MAPPGRYYSTMPPNRCTILPSTLFSSPSYPPPQNHSHTLNLLLALAPLIGEPSTPTAGSHRAPSTRELAHSKQCLRMSRWRSKDLEWDTEMLQAQLREPPQDGCATTRARRSVRVREATQQNGSKKELPQSAPGEQPQLPVAGAYYLGQRR